MNLSEQQQAVVEAIEPRIAVLATPGSGKTRTLVARVQHMIEVRGIAPSSIVLLTFTRYAAREMRNRLGRWANKLGFIGTFHAYCLAIVQQYGHTRGWEPEWLTLMDEEEASLEQKEILADLGLIDRKGRWMKCKASQWIAYREARVNGSDIPALDKVVLAKFHLVWDTFCDRLKAENVLTFGTLILEALELLGLPDVKQKIRAEWQHYLVDECQDTDGLQFSILEMVQPETLIIVGDLDQSIYGWRNARPDLFFDYAQKAQQYQLTQSYRFGFNIAEPASKLIAHNDNRPDIAIDAIANNSGTVKVVKNALFQSIAGLIESEFKDYAPDDTAVLARRHATLDCLSEELDRQKVAHVRVGGACAVPATGEFRTVKGYLRLAVNPRDRRAFMAVATAEGITNNQLWEIRKIANDTGASLYESFVDVTERSKFPDSISGLKEYLPAIDKKNYYGPAFSYLDDVVSKEGLHDPGELVRYLQMESLQDQMRSVEPGNVTLCTIHAAKGLEWPLVFLVGMNSREFPSPRSVREGRGEEERRLCYVAMTRAERKLYLIQCASESPDDGSSEFFDEMGCDA